MTGGFQCQSHRFARQRHDCGVGRNFSLSGQVVCETCQLLLLCTQKAVVSQGFERILQSVSTWQGGQGPRFAVAGMSTQGEVSD